MTKNIVIVGLSFAGINAVDALNKQSLPEDVRIIGIDRKHFGFYPPISIKASIVEGFESLPFQTFENVFPQGSKHRIISGNSVVEIGENMVTLSNHDEEFGTQVHFEKLIIATGSEQSFPKRPPHNISTLEEAKNMFIQSQKDIKEANDILVVGGGASGVEFMGEVTEAYPEKNVTLVHSSDHLISKFWSKTLSDTLIGYMHQRNLNVILNDTVDLGEHNYTGPLHEKKTFQTKGGQNLDADYLFMATGNKINSQLIEKFVPSAIDEKTKSVKITEQMHLEANPNIFVIGDIASIDLPKMAANLKAQAKTIAHNISHPNDQKRFEAPPVIGIAISFGKSLGAVQINSWVFGTWLCNLIKGADVATNMLFVPKYNYKPKSWFSGWFS